MINILYNGRIIYRNINEEEAGAIILEMVATAEEKQIDTNLIEIEEIN
jgi:(2Fe-2S) ferredoxin